MSLPSLFKVGAVVPQPHMSKSEKNKASNSRAIDYLMDFVGDRIPKRRGEQPAVRPRKLGDKVILLKSGTGSGKSSAFPAELFVRFFERNKKEIIVTQPSVFNAIDVSTQITKHYPTIKFGTTIAYQTGPMKKSKSSKGLTFMTVRILQNMLQGGENERFARKNSFVIIDEVHTRSKAVDSVLFLIKKFLEDMWDNPECPIFVLASATFDKRVFMEYFDIPKQNYLQVAGATFPIENIYPAYSVNNYVDYAIHMIKKIHVNGKEEIDKNEQLRDIVVFISGSEAKDFKKGLDSFNVDLLVKGYDTVKTELNKIDTREKFEYKVKGGATNDNYFVAPIVLNSTTFNKIGKEFKDLGSLIKDITIEVFDPKTKTLKTVKPVRKVFIATPFAETGVTIETLKYCVDTGWVMNPEFNQDFNAQLMKVCNVTQGMTTQRRGRTGRKGPGVFHPCFTEDTYKMMLIDDHSNMIKEESSDLMLTFIIKETKAELVVADSKSMTSATPGTLVQKHYMSDKDHYTIKTAKPFNIAAMDLLEPPSGAGITLSLEKLYTLGFIDYKYDVTLLGLLANKVSRLTIEPLKFILHGYATGAYILDLITIVAFIEVGAHKFKGKNYKHRNPLKLKEREAVFYNSVVVADDFVDYLFIWYEFMEQLDKLGKKMSVANIKKVEEWCDENDLKFASLMHVHKTRNDLMENFVQNGFDIFRNGLNLERGTYSLVEILKNNLREGLDEVKKIKKCLVEGFRFNLAVWDPKSNHYTLLRKSIPLKVDNQLVKMLLDPSQIEQNRPTMIVTEKLYIQKNRDSGIYEFHAGAAISVLDGFVDVDAGFLR